MMVDLGCLKEGLALAVVVGDLKYALDCSIARLGAGYCVAELYVRKWQEGCKYENGGYSTSFVDGGASSLPIAAQFVLQRCR